METDSLTTLYERLRQLTDTEDVTPNGGEEVSLNNKTN